MDDTKTPAPGGVTIMSRWGRVIYTSSKTSVFEALREAIVSGAVLTGADLTGADLTGAVLTDAVLTGAVLTDAVLTDAVLTGADLTGADLTGADLTGADLTRADLTGADLTRADLTRAVLTGASFEAIRSDYYALLDAAPVEVPALLAALREGRVDGSVYTGECACLVGTIANARGVQYTAVADLAPNSARPAERWALAIRRGDTPATSPVCALTVEWTEAWIAARPAP